MTSIEWLLDQVEHNISKTIIEQAKEMHKQEIIDAWYNGYINQSPMIDEENCGEHFYQETFKKEITSQLPNINVNDVKPSNPQMIKENFTIKNKKTNDRQDSSTSNRQVQPTK
jgi:predicted transcriptional regulator